ncbi:MAG: hypothetical protein EHM72_17695, partial [Calditrichaeota bacterium]
MKTALSFALMMVMIPIVLLSQQKAPGTFVEPKNGYWDEIKKTVKEFNQKESPAEKKFKADLS